MEAAWEHESEITPSQPSFGKSIKSGKELWDAGTTISVPGLMLSEARQGKFPVLGSKFFQHIRNPKPSSLNPKPHSLNP